MKVPTDSDRVEKRRQGSGLFWVMMRKNFLRMEINKS